MDWKFWFPVEDGFDLDTVRLPWQLKQVWYLGNLVSSTQETTRQRKEYLQWQEIPIFVTKKSYCYCFIITGGAFWDSGNLLRHHDKCSRMGDQVHLMWTWVDLRAAGDWPADMCNSYLTPHCLPLISAAEAVRVPVCGSVLPQAFSASLFLYHTTFFEAA